MPATTNIPWSVLANNGFRYDYVTSVAAPDWRAARTKASEYFGGDHRSGDFKVRSEGAR